MAEPAFSSKPVVQMHEKRKFNWVVLALLTAVIAAFLANLFL
jgi:hypothetical protein